MNTNRMGLTQEELRKIREALTLVPTSKVNGVNFGSIAEAIDKLLAYREASKEPVAWSCTFTQINKPDNSFSHMFTDIKAMESVITLHKLGGFDVEVTPFYTSPPLQDMTVPDGWIKCNERMPEQHKAILIFNEYGEIWSGAFDRDWNFFCDNIEVPNVTHWMPYPTPPKN